MVRRRHHGFRWWLAWAGAGFMLAIGALGGMGQLVFVVPLGILATVLVAVWGPGWPEVSGLAFGPDLLCVLIARTNFLVQACPRSPIIVHPGDPSPAVCGDAYPIPWLAAGIVLISFALGGYITGKGQRSS